MKCLKTQALVNHRYSVKIEGQNILLIELAPSRSFYLLIIEYYFPTSQKLNSITIEPTTFQEESLETSSYLKLQFFTASLGVASFLQTTEATGFVRTRSSASGLCEPNFCRTNKQAVRSRSIEQNKAEK